MRVLVNRYADGSLGGLLKAYVRVHMSHCKQCHQAVQILRDLRKQLAGLKTSGDGLALSADRWEAIRLAADSEPAIPPAT